MEGDDESFWTTHIATTPREDWQWPSLGTVIAWFVLILCVVASVAQLAAKF
jgi:hypothetical protein